MIGWVLAAVGAWGAVGALVGVVVGRIIRLRDRQVPHKDLPDTAVPQQRSAPDPSLARERELRPER